MGDVRDSSPGDMGEAAAKGSVGDITGEITSLSSDGPVEGGIPVDGSVLVRETLGGVIITRPGDASGGEEAAGW